MEKDKKQTKQVFYAKVSAKDMSSEKIHIAVKLNERYQRADGTHAIYIYMYMDRKKKLIPLNLFVTKKQFSKKDGRVRKTHPKSKDYNFLIEKTLSELYDIELNFRLREQPYNLERILKEWKNPSDKTDFLKFYETELKKENGYLKSGTYRQQMSTLNKLRKWKSKIYFHAINDDMIKKLTIYLRHHENNSDATIFTTLKNLKKFLNKAKEQGINLQVDTKKIKIIRPASTRIYLDENELKNLYKYYESDFINQTHKNILQMFLFSCFTGLRYADVVKLTKDNFTENDLFFTAEKTGKMQRIRLSQTSKKFIDIWHSDKVFPEIYTNEYINRELKLIAKNVGIRKKISFHVARHTFATQFLLQGGKVEALQKILAHSSIRETMVYVHIVQSVTDEQIILMDNILKD